MPIFRYFMFVGGALLALLFVVDYVQPSAPAAQAIATTSSDPPLIRIRSDRHLPERVVLDTSQPAIAAPVVTAAVVAPLPPVQESTSPASADMSAKARVRETFAQFTPAAPKPDAASAKKTQVQPKRRVARAHPAPQFGWQFGRPVMVAQQPHFGLFNTTW
jgi:hypothetical protein